MHILPTKHNRGNALLLMGTARLVEVLVLDVLHQSRVACFVPPELTFGFKAVADGSNNVGEVVSITLHAKHHVKGDLQSNGRNR